MTTPRTPRVDRIIRAAIAVLATAAVAACTSTPTATTTIAGPSLENTGSAGSAAPTPTAVGCPGTLTLAILIALDSSSRLACFGGAAISLHGVFGCGGCGGVETRTATPAWLANEPRDFLNDDSSIQAGRLALRLPPPLVAPPAGSILQVIGHFDDPRAADCRIAEPAQDDPEGTPVPIPEGEAIQYCREQFVVDSFEIVGTGPPPLG